MYRIVQKHDKLIPSDQFFHSVVDRGLVAIHAQSHNTSLSLVRQITMSPEWLSGVHIRDMHLDKWDRNASKSIADGNTRVCVRPGVDNNSICFVLLGSMDAIN